MNKIKVLHITPHLGGGVLSAYTGITKMTNEFEHEILLLEEPQKPEQLNKILKNNCKIHKKNTADVYSLIQEADIVQINWWHHPAMCDFLNKFPQIPVRSCLWIHVSGCTYPFIRKQFIEKFDFTFFAAKKCYDNPEISSLPKNFLSTKTQVIYGMGYIDSYLSVQRENVNGFNIGYAGTLAPSKIHPRFIEFCSEIRLRDTKFIVVGDDNNKEYFTKDIEKCDMRNQIEFWGFRRDMHKVYAQFDVFGYPLNPMHFGATENVLLEAMAAGLPVVALGGGVEEDIVEDGKTGILVNNKNEYGHAIRYLHDNKNVRYQMGENARKSVISRFDHEKNRNALYKTYQVLMKNNKRTVDFSDLWGPEPADWFLFAVENEKGMFSEDKIDCLPYIFREYSKSSVFHFSRQFPQDSRLNKWACMLTENIRL